MLKLIIDALEESNKKNYLEIMTKPIWLSVVDLGGLEILSYFKEGGCENRINASKTNAFRKAHTAMTYGVPTGPKRDENNNIIVNPYESSLVANGYFSNIPGGSPIVGLGPKDVLYGVGISGLTPEEDEQLVLKIIEEVSSSSLMLL
jgi:uncharacterized protein GlcG (DUF336 family)